MTSTTPSLTGHLRATKILFVVGVAALVACLLGGARWASDQHLFAAIVGGPADPYVAEQVETPPAHLSAAETARYRQFAAAPVTDAAPLVLAYHDVQAHPKGSYALTPQRFEEQMAMLTAAGFHTITAAQLTAWQHGKELAPRSVLLTFDDGTAGLWKYADPILRRHGFTGASFVITGDLAAQTGGYYLSWPEIAEMQKSGRWAIESHSNKGHGVVPIDATGRTGAFFVNRQWLAGPQRLETLDEFRARITADLDAVGAAFAAHSLPAPTFFAQPRSATVKDANDPATVDILSSVLAERYGASFINRDFASQLRPTDVQTKVLPRLELLGADSASGAFDKLDRAVAAPVTDVRPFTFPHRWVGDDGKPVAGVAPDQLTLDAGTGTWMNAHYAPGASANWARYGATVDVDRLGANGADVSAGITVFDGSAEETLVSVSTGYVRVRRASPTSNQVLGEARVPAASRHSVVVAVDSGRLVVTVDNSTVFTSPTPDASATGGIALSVWRRVPNLPVPTFTGLRLAP